MTLKSTAFGSSLKTYRSSHLRSCIMVNAFRAVRFGILWGLVALILALIEFFLRPIISPALDVLRTIGLSLPWFAVMMAGVHFGARSGYHGWLASVFGGGISGLIAALFIVIFNYIFPPGDLSIAGN